MTETSKIDNFINEQLDKSIAELKTLTAQPSVGAQNWGMQECAELVAQTLIKRGFSVEILPTEGAPVVLGEKPGKSDQTLLFYNHYDVQPPEPLELWESPPFEPAERDGKLFGRGVSDDKGHITARLHAIDAILNLYGELPCNIKFIIEGEEETGSVHLPDFIRSHRERLTADACIWEFGGVDHRGVPMQYLGLRGICYVELSVETASTDVHSGLGGSIFPNAAWRLVWALNTLKTLDEQVPIPGFYDHIKPPSDHDRELMASLPDYSLEYKNRYNLKGFLKQLKGGVDLNIAEVFEPTCTICGLTSGYQGAGSKTVLPSKASAKIDFRLVPDQTPKQILEGLRKHLDANGFNDVQMTHLGGGPPARTDPEDPFIKLVVETANEVYDKPMQLVPMVGGSGPTYPFIHDLGLPVASAGLGYPGTCGHAPNENIRFDLYIKHASHMARLIMEFSKKMI